MTAFVVMDREGKAPGSETEFVRDRFSVIAFVVPVIWLAWHRLWIEAVVALAAAVGLAALGTVAGFQSTAPLLSFLVSIFVAIEGPQLRVAALERRGYRQIATVEADNASEAELRHFAGSDLSDRASVPTVDKSASPAAAKGPWNSGPALGLLDYPDGR